MGDQGEGARPVEVAVSDTVGSQPDQNASCASKRTISGGWRLPEASLTGCWLLVHLEAFPA